MEIINFADALAQVPEDQDPHLLLGNGFSRAWRDDIFSYASLFDRADFGELSRNAREAFDALHTRDFEVVMRALREASLLLQLYSPSEVAYGEIIGDIEGLRRVLVRSISESHPSRPGEISAEAYVFCRRFLSHFKTIYTLNYDLLLYWALMQEDIEPDVAKDDGFRRPDSGEEEYVAWDPGSVSHQNIHYLHGALHLFDSGPELQKYTWINTGVALIDQIRDALARNFYPHFVSEGDSKSKLTKIRHSAYLARGERSFVAIGGSLFTYGVSFAASDNHLSRWLIKNKVRRLFAGLYGDSESEENLEIMRSIHGIATSRENGIPLDVCFYRAESANVWGRD